ncbi:MAG: polysaccharide biosynthesis tyrosine autokinase [Actinomycetota bacterium]
MQFHDFLEILLKRWKLIVASVLLVVGATVWYTMQLNPVYEARARVFLSTENRDGEAGPYVITRQDLNTYIELLGSPVVMEPLREELGIEPGTPVSVTGIVSEDTNILGIVAIAPSGQLAADLANAAGPALADIGGDYSPLLASAGQRVESTSITAAGVPGAPVSPNMTQNVALAVLAGLALGIGLVLLRHFLDTKVRSEVDLRMISDRPLLARLRRLKEPSHGLLVVDADPHSVAAEEFRRLRTNLQFVDVTTGGKHSFVVTSAMPSEGKTLSAVNLSLALSRSGMRVLLVDADLRHPSVAAAMGLEGSVGLTTILLGRAALDDVVQQWGETSLYVLPAGEIPPNPSELLGSAAMEALFEEFLAAFDFVIVDSPPVLPVIDPVLINRLVGGMLLVVTVNRTKKRDLAHALKNLATVDIKPAGFALNMVPGGNGYGKYGSYYAYGRDSKKGRKAAETQAAVEPAPVEELPEEPAARAKSARPGAARAEAGRAKPSPSHDTDAPASRTPANAGKRSPASPRLPARADDDDPLAFIDAALDESRTSSQPVFPPVRES